MNRLMLYTNVLALATISLFGGALVVWVVIDKTTAGQLALCGFGSALATVATFALEVFIFNRMGKAAGNSSSREQLYKAYRDQ